MRRSSVILCLIALVLAACDRASETPLSLPTAVPPTGEAGSWAIAFEYEFPGEFWGEGPHRYAFMIRCPIVFEEDFSSDWQNFEVSEGARLQPAPVYLRLQGLSVESFVPAYVSNAVIHPVQQTLAVAYLVGLSRSDAEQAVSECEAAIFWDDKGGRALTAKEPFQP